MSFHAEALRILNDMRLHPLFIQIARFVHIIFSDAPKGSYSSVV